MKSQLTFSQLACTKCHRFESFFKTESPSSQEKHGLPPHTHLAYNICHKQNAKTVTCAKCLALFINLWSDRL